MENPYITQLKQGIFKDKFEQEFNPLKQTSCTTKKLFTVEKYVSSIDQSRIEKQYSSSGKLTCVIKIDKTGKEESCYELSKNNLMITKYNKPYAILQFEENIELFIDENSRKKYGEVGYMDVASPIIINRIDLSPVPVVKAGDKTHTPLKEKSKITFKENGLHVYTMKQSLFDDWAQKLSKSI